MRLCDRADRRGGASGPRGSRRRRHLAGVSPNSRC